MPVVRLRRKKNMGDMFDFRFDETQKLLKLFLKKYLCCRPVRSQNKKQNQAKLLEALANKKDKRGRDPITAWWFDRVARGGSGRYKQFPLLFKNHTHFASKNKKTSMPMMRLKKQFSRISKKSKMPMVRLKKDSKNKKSFASRIAKKSAMPMVRLRRPVSFIRNSHKN